MIEHTKCRLCKSKDIEQVIDLGCSPLANAYLDNERLEDVRMGKVEEIFTPLRCFMCLSCGSVQLSHSVPWEVLFSDYIYASSTSPAFVAHFTDLANHVKELGLVSENDLVVDVGSNDGIGLKAFKDIGCRVMGVEPSEKLASIAAERGLPTICSFLDDETASHIRRNAGPSKVVAATNVFAHLSELEDFVLHIRDMLDKDGVFVFENSYLGDVVDNLLFDTIYMEHQFYHSVRPLVRFMRHLGLPVFRVERIPTHGGSIRVFCGDRPEESSVREMLAKETYLGELATYRAFMDRLNTYKQRLHSMLRPFAGHIVAYGCPAKFTTLCYALGLTDAFRLVVDDSPLKCGMFTPGSHLSIVSSDNIQPDDLIFVSAWNFFDSIYARKSHPNNLWMRPLPKLEIL